MKTKYTLLILLLLSISSTFAQKVFSVDHAYQADITVFATDYDYQADLLVYKTDHDYQVSGNKGLWFFTYHDYQADKKVFFTDHDYQADLKIFFVDNSYQAKWRDKSKIHLLY